MFAIPEYRAFNVQHAMAYSLLREYNYTGQGDKFMQPNDVRGFLQKRPFEPIQVTLTDGRSYEVRHPEMAMVGWTTVAIGVTSSNELHPIFDRLVTVSLQHIMQIEPIFVPASPTRN
jgi:hypothetical protein